MFWPVEMKQLQNISVGVNVMLPNTDFASFEKILHYYYY